MRTRPLNRMGKWGAFSLLAAAPAIADVTLIGTASIPGDDRDKSRLRNVVCGTFPHNRLGAFGSSIDYTGKNNLYIACSDRGPGDGAAAYQPRFHSFRIVITPDSTKPVEVELVSTTILTDESGCPFSGLAGSLATSDPQRYDPEGVRLSKSGSLFISDEYGPCVDEFSHDGRRMRRFQIPRQFQVACASADPKQELPPHNTSGRVSNRGFEGLALSPDGSRLWAILQSPLIQDGALSKEGQRIGRYCRILEINTSTCATREHVYTLENPNHGVSEVLALSNHELLVLERDGERGAAAKSRGLYKVNISAATDVSSIPSLPSDVLTDAVKPVTKSLWLDFLDKRFILAGPTMPEKIEGLTLGPTLSDGRRTLIVTTDNDLKPDEPSWFWVFAFDR